MLCVVTPDPSLGRPRKLAGARWWGYLPAHTVLLPRRTLRELISARGLVISADVPFVRTFAARRWVGGLAERLGPLSGPLTRAADRLPPVPISLSLGDERVILAHRTPVRHALEPLLRSTDGHAQVHVVLPAYNAVRTIPDVVNEMPAHAADRALLIDDALAGRDVRGRAPRTGSTCSATRPTAATARARRPATCARCATAPRWS